jgi:hypothetical protein
MEATWKRIRVFEDEAIISMKEAIIIMKDGSVRVFVNDDTDGAVDGVALYGLERNALRHRTWPRQAVWRTKVDHAP